MESLLNREPPYCTTWTHFVQNILEGPRISVHQGGSRSGKTYSICEGLIALAGLNRFSEPMVFTISRKTLVALKASALRDFIEILQKQELYRKQNHNLSKNEYLLYNTLFEFIGVDEPQKIRGRKRAVLFMNEANEFTWQDFVQFNLRTTGRIIMDYNPSDELHWIYDKILPRKDCEFFKTTYLNNPFLPDELRNEIEGLRDVDDNLWRVFGLGERGSSRATIYNHWNLCEQLPEGGEDIYGLDFGFNNPTALVQLRIKDDEIYAHELMYQSGLTNSDLLQWLPKLITNRQAQIFADAAEPQRIEEIYRQGFNIKPADKSVKDGIDRIRRAKLHITSNSVNLLKEIKSYKYQEDKDGKILEEPVKLNDHLCDALRYAFHTYMLKPSGKYVIL